MNKINKTYTTIERPSAFPPANSETYILKKRIDVTQLAIVIIVFIVLAIIVKKKME